MPAFFRYCDTNGDGTGSKDGAVDASLSEVRLKLLPRFTAIEETFLHRMIVGISDAGTFDSGAYGNNITLTNGIEVGIYAQADDAQILDLLDGDPIMTNGQWAEHCHDISRHDFGTGDEWLTVRWTFARSGTPVKLREDEYFGIVLNDDLSGLERHRFVVQGVD